MVDPQVFAFLGVSVLVTITPGADMALMTKHALTSGRRTAFMAALGITNGLFVWAALSAAGVAAILNASATAFTVLKLAGGAYLIFLGLRTILRTRGRADDAQLNPLAARAVRTTDAQAYRQGLFTNLLNPKPGVFFTSFLPQFVSADDHALAKSLALALVHILIGLVWMAWYIQVVVKASKFLTRPSVRRWLDRATGAVLVALGLRLAVERR